jgi:hypothetical protein
VVAKIEPRVLDALGLDDAGPEVAEVIVVGSRDGEMQGHGGPYVSPYNTTFR